ncbi:MAG: PA14 domain-containing protein, partial [Planctomycetales bacterium]
SHIDLQQVLAKVPTKDNKPPESGFAVRFHGLLEVPTDGEYRFWTKSDDGSVLRVNDKTVVDNDGQHPPQEKEGKVTLRRGRHKFELIYTQGGGGFELAVKWAPPGAKELKPIAGGVLLNQAGAMIPKGIADFKLDATKVERGRELFAKMRCVACHETGEKLAKAIPAAPLAKLNPSAKNGCLSTDAAAGLPRYDLNDVQRVALRDALAKVQKGLPPDSPEDRARFAMTTLNCYACHQRGEIGGPDAARSDYFVYETIVDLGDEGRLPPPLHEVGAKLSKTGFDAMLHGGQKYRTYMAARMPQFGKKNVDDLPALFEAVDAGKVPSHQPEFSPRLIDAGRFLMGKKALSCINCHAWGEHRLPGAEGMDLLESPRRLKPAWFHAWLKTPQAMRRGTRMPTAWPKGKTFFPDVAGGSADRQIDAIWAYLSVGRKGGTPPGLSPDDDSLLRPDDQTIVFRTFLDQVSAHAILVGFRQRTHMAFDANRVRGVLAWTGPFISTKHAWSGRAGQYAKIESSDLVKLPEGPPFAQLESNTSSWPQDVPKPKTASPRAPDGWRFRGYRLGKDRSPTFLYDVKDVRVEETPGTDFNKDSAVLTRTFSLTSPRDLDGFYFLAATGESIEEENGVYEVDGKLRFRVTSSPDARPVIRSVENARELLVPVKFVKNKDRFEAKFVVEMKW